MLGEGRARSYGATLGLDLPLASRSCFREPRVPRVELRLVGQSVQLGLYWLPACEAKAEEQGKLPCLAARQLGWKA